MLSIALVTVSSMILSAYTTLFRVKYEQPSPMRNNAGDIVAYTRTGVGQRSEERRVGKEC